MKPNHKSGMSLIELTVTMLIIGIVAAVAVPKVTGAIATTRLETAATQMVVDIETARRYAMSTGTSQQINFFVATNEYKLINMPDPNHPGTTQYVVDFDDLQGSVSITDVNFYTTNFVIFDMYGKPNIDGTITLQSGSLTKIITVDAVTGKVTVT